MVIDLKKTKRIHLVGIKGVGMSALALMLKGRRFEVTGSDVTEEFITDKNLRAAQIPVRPFGASNISSSIDLVITTPAWGKTNPEVASAKNGNSGSLRSDSFGIADGSVPRFGGDGDAR